jgi:hypothetical protein
MSNVREYKLIDGDFSPEESQKILMSLINNKIDFHNLFAFSNHIRFNNDMNVSKKRIDELTVTRDEIISLIRASKEEGKNFRIKSNISIELI